MIPINDCNGIWNKLMTPTAINHPIGGVLAVQIFGKIDRNAIDPPMLRHILSEGVSHGTLAIDVHHNRSPQFGRCLGGGRSRIAD
jgi:hypothetical protein